MLVYLMYTNGSKLQRYFIFFLIFYIKKISLVSLKDIEIKQARVLLILYFGFLSSHVTICGHYDRILIKVIVFCFLKILFLTDANYTVRLYHRNLLEKADASTIAAFRFAYSCFALLVKETGLVHVCR